jgi:hypothetical protein
MDMPRESWELMTTLAAADPAARTARSQWTVHDLVAHLAAGAKENADLIEDALAGRPARATRTFAEREAAFVAMPDEQPRQELVVQSSRKLTAVERLAARGPDATYQFTGRPFSAALARTHGRSEAAIHRWDIAGDDQTGMELLAAPELTRHAVEMLAIWGRRAPDHPVSVIADPKLWAPVATVLWDATP